MMYFKFTKLTSEEAYADIIQYIKTRIIPEPPKPLADPHITQETTVEETPVETPETNSSTSTEYLETMKQKIHDRGYTFRGFLRVPDNDEQLMRRVIGKRGYYFHLTTEKNQIDFIWYDKTSHQFLFWGEKRNLIRAMNIMVHRLRSKVDAMY